ncbi:hypothetical protein [Streptomyces sp. NBC_01233]|uniref:hypothetical protein n=1 Tax=Streptomyces sp. NBC_01233 TaxID=2903787 RepID=UPI002E115DBA|nr:hypothetical protein OG332_02715 [Streptomyces sp. NBC_01233]
MGDARAYPGATVDLDAELCRVEDVLKAREMFPQGWYSGGGWHFRGIDLPGDATALTGMLPLTLSVAEPVGSDLPERAAGVLPAASWGQIAWMALSWPAVPELDLGPEHARTGVQACFNSDANHEPAAGYTVYAHVHPFAGERAQHLARQIGHDVVGPGEHGW